MKAASLFYCVTVNFVYSVVIMWWSQHPTTSVYITGCLISSEVWGSTTYTSSLNVCWQEDVWGADGVSVRCSEGGWRAGGRGFSCFSRKWLWSLFLPPGQNQNLKLNHNFVYSMWRCVCVFSGLCAASGSVLLSHLHLKRIRSCRSVFGLFI